MVLYKTYLPLERFNDRNTKSFLSNCLPGYLFVETGSDLFRFCSSTFRSGAIFNLSIFYLISDQILILYLHFNVFRIRIALKFSRNGISKTIFQRNTFNLLNLKYLRIAEISDRKYLLCGLFELYPEYHHRLNTKLFTRWLCDETALSCNQHWRM